MLTKSYEPITLHTTQSLPTTATPNKQIMTMKFEASSSTSTITSHHQLQPQVFSPLSPSRKTSRAALALNNTAVSFLERGCFQDSLHTLTDATEIIKLASWVLEAEQHADEDTMTASSAAAATEAAAISATTTKQEATPMTTNKAATNHLTAVDQTLDKASKRIATVCCQTNNKNRSEEPTTEISSLEDDDVDLLKAAGAYASSSAIAFPIRLRADVAECDNEDSSDDDPALLDLQACVISYNRGLAFLLAYEQQHRREQQQQQQPPQQRQVLSNKLLAAACKSFSLAHAMMIQHLKARSSRCEPQEHYEHLRALFILRLVLGKLFQVIRHQRRSPKQMQAVLDSLILLDKAVIRLEKTTRTSSVVFFPNTNNYTNTIAPAA
jgi:hypothetical protein